MLSRSCKTFLFPLLVLFLFVVIAGLQTAKACSCGRQPTVLDAYDHADVVVIVRAVSVEKATPEQTAPDGQMSDGENYVDGVKSTTMSVVQVFKGSLKVGDEMVFAQGGGADCIWTFNEDSIGKKFLFYLKRFGDSSGVMSMTSAGSRKVDDSAKSTVWIAVTCGRSNNVDYAGDDLLYLNNLQKARGRTRISGTLSFDHKTGESVAGRKLRIVGAKNKYEVKTDENGVYELYDVPAGKYAIVPEIPKGWKVGRFWLGYSPSFVGMDEKSPNQIIVVLEAKKHAGLDVRFDIDNAIRGFINDPWGRPMKDVCLDLVPADGSKGAYLADCSKKDGSFEIDEIPPGSYVIVINDDGKIDSDEPFGTFYYPNVKKRDKATVFHIGLGDFIEDVQIHPPVEVEIITVEGVFLFSDGKPVASEWVSFKSARVKKHAGNDADGDDDNPNDARAETDSQGKFSIKILKGSSGQLFGEMLTFLGEFENCPKLDRIIKEAGRDMPLIRTPAVEILAENSLYNIELKYPFPSCKKAKIE